jgi:putative ABC transport system permease protein
MAAHKNNMHPPRLVDRFLEWFLPAHLQEEVHGDLQEVFCKQAKEKGVKQARRAYLFAAIHYIQSLFFQTQEKIIYHAKPLHTDMLRNYFTIAFRNPAAQQGIHADQYFGPGAEYRLWDTHFCRGTIPPEF